MLANNYSGLQEKISSLIDELHDPDGLKRQEVRHNLIKIGWDAVPQLIEVVSKEEDKVRWEAIEALGYIRDPEAAPILVEALLDENTDNRWAASNALIELDRASLKPLFAGLMKHFGSTRFRIVAHHVLHVLKDRGRLLSKEIKVLDALEDIEPEATVPWAAKAAFDDLEKTNHK